MKKLHFLLLTFLIVSFRPLFAVPAIPEPIQATQPDGTILTIRLHGDEFFHYTSTEDGFLVVKNAQNYYVYAQVAANGQAQPTARIARNANARTASDASFLQSLNVSSEISRMRSAVSPAVMQRAAAQSSYEQPQRTPKVGSPNLIVLLVEFSDRSFVNRTTAQTRYSNLVNQVGYNANGGTGSVRDFYKASSYGQFTPNFVVMPPVTLSHTAQYYCDNDGDRVPEMVIEACALLDAAVNFAQYDNDNDGRVDNVLCFVAGWDRAQYADDATNVWSHRWAVQPGYNYSGTQANTIFDSKRVYDYFVTSELRGNSGTNMVNIGTFCHEFGHILGLPDYYHTGDSDIPTLSYWSTMASGGYCNTLRTPPLFSAYDRFFLGWLTPEQYTGTSGQKTLYPLSQSGTAATAGQAYLIANSTHNLNGGAPNPAEFFVIEQREKTGWDAYIGNNSTSGTGGMLIWHIDYTTPWSSPNNYTGTTQTQSSHMRVYIEPTNGLSQTTPGGAFTSGAFTPKLWNGTALTAITNITRNGTINMTFGINAACPSPTAITANSITTGSAVIVWTPAGSETQWQFQYSTNSDFSDATTETLNAATKNLSGLSSNTQYYIRARAVCTSENSAWREGNFRTECALQTLPLIENFENAYPTACWTEYGDDVFIQNIEQNHTTVGSKSIRYTENSTPKTRGLITPQVTLPANGAIFSFYLRTDEFWGQSNYYHTYRIKVSTTNNQPSSFTTIKEFSSYNYSGINANKVILTEANIENSWYRCEADLSAFAGQTIYAALEAYDHYGAATTYIDDIEITEIEPTAPIVETLAATNRTQTSATLNKVVNAGTETITAQGFKYRKASDSNWETSTNGILTDLTPNTEYQFYAFATTATYPSTNGAVLSFSTLAHVAPVVVTQAATDKTQTSATLNKVVNTGTETIESYGFKYRKTGTEGWENSTDGILTDLTPNTEYEFYAFVTTETFDIHGNTLTFSTLTTGINNILENSISIFPNPVNDELRITNCELREGDKVEILDITGKLIFNFQFSIFNSIDVSGLQQGVYFVKITIDNQIVIKKIIKK